MRNHPVNSPLHGQLTNEVQNGAALARPYDALARPTGYRLMRNGGASPPGESFAVSYAYDALGHLASFAASSAGSFNFQPSTFNDLIDPIGNRVSATEYAESGDALASSYTANALNQYTRRTVPGTAQVRGFADPDADVSVCQGNYGSYIQYGISVFTHESDFANNGVLRRLLWIMMLTRYRAQPISSIQVLPIS